MGRGDHVGNRYIVTGIHPAFGHAPGETFVARIPKTQERDLILGGAIDRVHEEPKPKPPAGSKPAA